VLSKSQEYDAVLHGSGGVLVYETGTESLSWLFNGGGWERRDHL